MMPAQRQQLEKSRARNQYNRLSIGLHWISAIAIVALFITHEAPPESAGMAFHIGGGAILGIVLLWRVVRRMIRGRAQKPVQENALNIIASIVTWFFLISILVVTVTGYLLPWSHGEAFNIYGFKIAAPLDVTAAHHVLELAHKVAGHLFIPLIILHLLAVLKHAVIDRDDVAGRMFKSNRKGH